MATIRPIVTIDGASGVGKSTAAVRVAQRLGVPFLNTGSIYRAAALACGFSEVDLSDPSACGKVVEEAEITLVDGVATFINGVDVSQQIRSAFATKNSSVVSSYPRVRLALLELQRNAAKQSGCVAEGRDTGTVVFPDAHLKIYLTATRAAQLERRVEEIMTSRGLTRDQIDLAEVIAEIEERDARDSTRAMAPLVPASDAVHLDSSVLAIDEVVETIVSLAQERLARLG